MCFRLFFSRHLSTLNMLKSLSMDARSLGCLFGQLTGDALGARYEFKRGGEVTAMVARDLVNENGTTHLPIRGGGPFGMKPGQVTDDSEMACAMLECLLRSGEYKQEEVACAYVAWRNSHPPDIGNATSAALSVHSGVCESTVHSKSVEEQKAIRDQVLLNVSRCNASSRSNGALMRISPLAVAYKDREFQSWRGHIAEDARLTHSDPVVMAGVEVYTRSLHQLINGTPPAEVISDAIAFNTDPVIAGILADSQQRAVPVRLSGSKESRGDDCAIGYVGIALQVAFHILGKYGSSVFPDMFEKALIEVVSIGGDTDTNGCIAGAMLGAALGSSSIPSDWQISVLSTPARTKAVQCVQEYIKSQL